MPERIMKWNIGFVDAIEYAPEKLACARLINVPNKLASARLIKIPG